MPRCLPVLVVKAAGPLWLRGPAVGLFDLPAILLPVAFASQRLLGSELLSRLQVKRVAFHLFNDVLLLDLTLEAPEGVL